MNTAVEIPLVLIVDDNQDASEVLALLIETRGFATATARTLAQARECLASRLPRLVLLDLNLPDGEGLRLLADAKADPRTAGVRVAILSGMIDDKTRAAAHQLGVVDYFVKPLVYEQLTVLLDAVQ